MIIVLKSNRSEEQKQKFIDMLTERYDVTVNTWVGTHSTVLGPVSYTHLWLVLRISVTIGRPVFFRASFKSSSPSDLRPWKAYGEVRGLNAPPRRNVAPAALTRAATSQILSLIHIYGTGSAAPGCPPRRR